MARKTVLGNKSHEKSVKLRQETKNKIDEMLTNGTKITFENVMKECKVSKGFVYNEEIRKYIEAAKAVQKDEKLNLPNQQLNLYWKLMASYIFQYSLMDEQEEVLRDAMEGLRSRQQVAEYVIRLLAKYLAMETDSAKRKIELEEFQSVFREIIPNWKDKLSDLMEQELAQ